MPNRITLRDIADRVGVHPSTVSRVLNPSNNATLSSDVVRRVRETADALGYHPNPQAYGLRTNQSAIIGVVFASIENPVFPLTLRGIEGTLVEAGYIPLVANTEHDEERAKVVVDMMRSRHIDGMIIATGSPHAPIIIACKEDGLPTVLVHRTWGDDEIPSVAIDEAMGTRLIAEHIHGLGHREIAYMAGPLDLTTGRDRYFGTLKAFRDLGCEIRPELVVFSESFHEHDGIRATDDLLSRNIPFTALITSSDTLAVGCYTSLSRHGLKVPDDISVCGYNDIRMMDVMLPPLTTVNVPKIEMGAMAAKLMLDQLNNPDFQPRQMKLEPSLMIRASTARPPL